MKTRPKIDWVGALEAARQGDLEPDRLARVADPDGPLSDYFHGRCLAESGERLGEAVDCLRRALDADSNNQLTPQVLSLALVRSGQSEPMFEAAQKWQLLGLPHDMDLLGATAITMEMQMRPLPDRPNPDPLPWPEGLQRPKPDPTPPEAVVGEPDPSTLPPIEKPGFLDRRKLNRVLGEMEQWFLTHRPENILRRAAQLLDEGLENDDMHLLAGAAAEEFGDTDRARAHLARCIRLEPKLLIARTFLGRVYWRLGWFDLALALWRSLPVEGPFDHCRHYHLALGYAAVGESAKSLEAMRCALSDFYTETRFYYIKPIHERWQARYGEPRANDK